MLREISKTAADTDRMPYNWFFKQCFFEFAEFIAHMFMIDIYTKAPCRDNGYMAAVMTPASKIYLVPLPANFQPLSVTSIMLSRVLDKYFVSRCMAVPCYFIRLDCWPIGFSYHWQWPLKLIARLYIFLPHITRTLERNSYVRCLLMDYRKAFDHVVRF